MTVKEGQMFPVLLCFFAFYIAKCRSTALVVHSYVSVRLGRKAKLKAKSPMTTYSCVCKAWVYCVASFKTFWTCQPDAGSTCSGGRAGSSPDPASSGFWRTVDVGSLLSCLEGLQAGCPSVPPSLPLCSAKFPIQLWTCATGVIGPGPVLKEQLN